MPIGPLLRREIENTFNVVRDKCTPEELVIVCPERICGDSSGNRSINLRTGKTFCWRCNKGEHSKGTFLAWAKALGHAFSAESGSSGIPIDELLDDEAEAPASVVPLLQEVSLPEGFVPIARTPKSIYTELIAEMAARKNLSYEDFTAAGVGYTMDDTLWEPFAIFPVIEYGVCVYYQGRTYIDRPGESTKLFPNRKRVPFGASYWVYNIDEVRVRKPEIVVVVESILNVLSLKRKFASLGWDSVVPVCVFKHHISQVQVIKLCRCAGIRELCLLFDHDAIDATWRMVESLNEKVRVTVAEMPARADNRKLDPNDDVEAAIDAINRRKKYTTATATAHVLGSALGMASRAVDITGVSLQKIRS